MHHWMHLRSRLLSGLVVAVRDRFTGAGQRSSVRPRVGTSCRSSSIIRRSRKRRSASGSRSLASSMRTAGTPRGWVDAAGRAESDGYLVTLEPVEDLPRRHPLGGRLTLGEEVGGEALVAAEEGGDPSRLASPRQKSRRMTGVWASRCGIARVVLIDLVLA